MLVIADIPTSGVFLIAYLAFLVLFPLLILIAFWRIGTALYRIGTMMRETIYRRWPESLPEDEQT